MSDLVTFGLGLALGLSLAAPPGPMNALIASETLRGGWGAGFRTGLGAMAADVVFLLVAALGVLTVLEVYPALLGGLGVVGALVMAYFAYGAWRTAHAPAPPAHAATSFGAAFVVALTNPYQIMWWVTTGSFLLASLGVAMVAGLVGGILLWIGGFPVAVDAGTRWRWFHPVVAYGSAAVLVVFSVAVAWWSLTRLAPLLA